MSTQKSFGFQQALRRLLLSMGALPSGQPAYESRFVTRAGTLLCHPHEDWLAARFDHPSVARAIIPGGNLNPYSGKWNWHSTNKKPGFAEIKEVASLLAEVLVDREELKGCGFSLASATKPAEPDQVNTKIGYMYRDADNFKSYGEVVLAGRMSERDMKIILSLCKKDDDRFFIPGMVQLADLQDSFEGVESEWIDERDHPWHTFCEIKPTAAEATQGKNLTAAALVEVFLRTAITGGWDESYEPDFCDDMRQRKQARLTRNGATA